MLNIVKKEEWKGKSYSLKDYYREWYDSEYKGGYNKAEGLTRKADT